MMLASRLKTMLDACLKILPRDEKAVHISGSNGVITVSASAPTSGVSLSEATVDGKCDEFACSIEGAVLSKILGGSGAGEIELGLEREFFIKGLVNARLSVIERSVQVVPDTHSEYRLSAEFFRRCCHLTGRFASNEKGRYCLNVAHFEIDDAAVGFCATDGRKGVSADAEVKRISGQGKIEVNIPRDAAIAISAILPPGEGTLATVRVGNSVVTVASDNTYFWTLLQEGEFPIGWRAILPRSNNMVAIDGKHLSRFSEVMGYLEMEHARFVSDGKTLKIYGKSATVPEIDTELQAALEPCEMLLFPEILATAIFNNGSIQFGWGECMGAPEAEAAVLVSPPFSAFAMSCVK